VEIAYWMNSQLRLRTIAEREENEKKFFPYDAMAKRQTRNAAVCQNRVARLKNYQMFKQFHTQKAFNAVCSECGAKCEVPFKPQVDKPVYCHKCWSNHKPNRKGKTIKH